MQTDNPPAKNGAHAALRSLPSVDKVLACASMQALREELPQAILTAAARSVLDAAREAIKRGDPLVTTPDELARRAAEQARSLSSPSLRPVINASGVVIHTNLGRAPLSREAVQAVARAANYSNLEYNLAEGERGSRYTHAAGILKSVAGCEDALVVNNNAAALVLALAALAVGKEVVLSRGQSVEIGGGFRIPDVMRQGGARLVEVGTTNRTYTRDYTEAITADTAIIMRVHASNFRIVGFTTAPDVEELAALAHEHGLLMLDDIGSGALVDTTLYGLAPEPTVQASLKAGADLVLFSGDKLLGGPQCGIIAGKKEVVAQLKRHPLARALRVDKMTLAALEATLLHYLLGQAEQKVPVWQMISATAETLRETALSWVEKLQAGGIECEAIEGRSAIGGGSLPGETLPTWLVSIRSSSSAGPDKEEAGTLAARLRSAPTPVIARIEDGALLLDPRTVLPGESSILLAQVIAVCTGNQKG